MGGNGSRTPVHHGYGKQNPYVTLMAVQLNCINVDRHFPLFAFISFYWLKCKTNFYDLSCSIDFDCELYGRLLRIKLNNSSLYSTVTISLPIRLFNSIRIDSIRARLRGFPNDNVKFIAKLFTPKTKNVLKMANKIHQKLT